jgi:hypothetical protein
MLRFLIRGVSPLLLHNGQLSDPQNEWSKAMKVITGKKKKTDKDMDELARLEFMGGLYVDDNGVPCVPGENIEAMLQAEGAKNRMKRQVQSGVISDGNWPIIYDGPKTAEGLWEKRKEFALRKSVRNQQNRVMRVRPIFRAWALEFDVDVIEEEINAAQIKEFMPAAGRHTGLNDWRPKFGRFMVESVKEVG